MNLFFKLLAIGGIGGSIGGVAYLSQQSYTNVHEGAVVQRTESNIPEKGRDVKKQPDAESKVPETRQGASGDSGSTASGGGGNNNSAGAGSSTTATAG